MMMYFMCNDDCMLHYHDYDDNLDDVDYDDYYDDSDDEYGLDDDALNIHLALAERARRELETITDEQRERAEIARNSLLEETLHNSSSLDKETCKLFNDQRYSDIMLKVGDRKFYVHRLILSAWSDVFKTMFCDPTWQPNNNVPEPNAKDSSQCVQQDLIEEEQCAEVFEDFLKFLYSSSASLTTENVLPLCRLADKYLVTDLRELCLEYVQGKQDDLNAALHLLQSASELKMLRVVESCLEILQTNFNRLTWQQLQHLESKNLIALLDSGLRVLVDDEFVVFKKIEPWLRQCKDDDAFIQVVKLIRFPYMNATQLKKTANSDVILRAFKLIPDLELRFWQLQSLYKEGNLDKLPGDFPQPRMYFYGYKRLPSKAQQNQARPSHVKVASTEVKIDDRLRRREEAFRAWFGREVDGKQFYELKDSSFPFKVTKSTQSSNEIDIELFPISANRKRTQHVALEVEVAKRRCQYYRVVLQNDPDKNSSADASVRCSLSSDIHQPRPDKFKLRVSAVIECEEKKTPQEEEMSSDSA